jgi:hypothetical protein
MNWNANLLTCSQELSWAQAWGQAWACVALHTWKSLNHPLLLIVSPTCYFMKPNPGL